MHMNMPGMGGAEHQGGGHLWGHRKPMHFMVFMLFHSLFFTAATVCFLGAVNRASSALKMESRIKALKNMPDAFTEDEQMFLIEKITSHALAHF